MIVCLIFMTEREERCGSHEDGSVLMIGFYTVFERTRHYL
uniref:Uncharacterized protein n=1 Tax=Ascaris lumbricoides TaxID=6252 RepID=A0A0M3HVR5_ASCLU